MIEIKLWREVLFDIFTPDNFWWGGEYIVTLYFHSWQFLVRGWLYRDIIFLSWQYLVIEWKHFPHYWQFVRGIHRSPVNSPHKGQWRGALMFSLICVWINGWVNNREAGDLRRYRTHYDVIVMEGVIISWHYIFIPGNIWWGGDYIGTLYFHSWQFLVRGWLYRDIIFSLLKIFGEGVIISWHIFTPEDIWWGGDYIMTLQYNFWHYPRIWHWRWLNLNTFTIQIWLCSDTRVLLFISIYSCHETWGVEVIIFKHDTLFDVET